MWLSPERRAHSFLNLQEFHGFPRSAYQKLCFGRIQDYAGATVMLILCVEIPNMAFWHDSGSSRQDAAVRLIRGVEIPRKIFRHASGSSNYCLPARQLPQWK
eukprot:7468324-Pyramimonas_sp.AAC.1